MWENDIAPRLKARSDGGVLISRTLKTTGLGESMLDELLGDLRHAEDPTVGVYHKADGVHVRLASKAMYDEVARERIAPVEQEIRSMLGDAIWGADEDTFQEAVASLLKDRGMSIAVMESCTGGLLASTITDVPGASGYFRGGLVTYTAEAKIQYGVDGAVIEEHGVVSNETAVAMAGAVRRQLRRRHWGWGSPAWRARSRMAANRSAPSAWGSRPRTRATRRATPSRRRGRRLRLVP